MTVAAEVAQRLRDRRNVEAAFAAAARQAAFPQAAGWQPVSLAQGDAGVALACAYLDSCFREGDWDRIGHGYLSLAAGDAEQRPYLPSGHDGAAGVMLTLLAAATDAEPVWDRAFLFG